MSKRKIVGIVAIILALVMFFILMMIVLSATISASDEIPGVTEEAARYLAEVFFDEIERLGGVSLGFVVELISLETEVKRFQGYGLQTETLIVIAHVQWQSGERHGTFSVSETLRLATGGARVTRRPLTLTEHAKVIKKIAEKFVEISATLKPVK